MVGLIVLSCLLLLRHPCGGRDRCSASELRQAAVHGELAGGHEAAVRRRQEGSRRPELRRIAHALERSHRAVGLQALLNQAKRQRAAEAATAAPAFWSLSCGVTRNECMDEDVSKRSCGGGAGSTRIRQSSPRSGSLPGRESKRQKRRDAMMEHSGHYWMNGWMGGGNYFGPVIGILVIVLLVVLIVRLVRK